jgi:hypothetical protein
MRLTCPSQNRRNSMNSSRCSIPQRSSALSLSTLRSRPALRARELCAPNFWAAHTLPRRKDASNQNCTRQERREFGICYTPSATFRHRIRPRAPIGAFFLFVSKGVGRAIRPSETGRLAKNGSPNGPRLSLSAPRRPQDGAKHPRISNGLPRSWVRPVREIIR